MGVVGDLAHAASVRWLVVSGLWCDEDDALGWTIGLVSGLVSCVLLRELCSPVLSVERSESYNV